MPYRFAFILSACTALAEVSGPSAPTKCELVDLSTPGGTRSRALDINDRMQVVGQSMVSGDAEQSLHLYLGKIPGACDSKRSC